MAHLSHRRMIHSGIPTGFGLAAGDLQICYQWKTGLTTATETVLNESEEEVSATVVNSWDDQSPNGNDAAQSTTANKPLLNTDGSLEFFNASDAADQADSMEFTRFNIGTEAPYLVFIVCKLGDATTVCYLSDSGGEVLQYNSVNAHQFKAGGTTTNMTHSAVFSHSTGEKHLMVVERSGTEDIKMYKNGILCNGHANEGSTNDASFDLKYLGVKNNASNWFDGAIYDVIVIDGTKATTAVRKRVEDYLLRKHGLNRLGNG